MKYKFYLIAVALFLSFSMGANAQIIFTIAGTGASDYGGDGLLAINAFFNWPSAVATDTAGNVYIADMDNNIVRLVTPSGYITQFAGNTLRGYTGDGANATVLELNNPTAIALDSRENIYIADQYNHVVRKVDRLTNIITTYAGYMFEGYTGAGNYTGDNGPATSAQFYQPTGLAFDPAGNLYISDVWNSVIRKVDNAGIVTTIAGTSMDTGYAGNGGPATAAKLNSPMGMACDAAGNLYVADNYNNVIRKISTTGTISTVAGNGTYSGAGDHMGNYGGDGSAATNAQLSRPTDVKVDAAGNLFIADQYNHVIRKVNTSGIISTVAGNGNAGYSGDFGSAVSAKLNFPRGVAINHKGDLLIADMNNNVVRKVNVASVGIHEPTANRDNLQLILNPNKGIFQVKGTVSQTASQVTLAVQDMQGQVVYQNNIEVQNGTIDALVSLPTGLANGIYILRVNSGTETNVSRFVLEK